MIPNKHLTTALLLAGAFYFSNSLEISKQENGCTKTMRIKSPKIYFPHITNKEITAQMIVYQKEINAFVFSRSKWSSYCYDGGSLDTNTKCSTKLEGMLPSETEIVEWRERKMCKIGKICRVDGECWGKDAVNCFDNTTTEWVKSSKHRDIGQRYMLFAYHTCVSSWECSMADLSLRTHAIGSVEKHGALVPLPNGTSYQIRKNGNYIKIGKEGNKGFLINDKIQYIKAMGNLSCFFRGESIKCLTKENEHVSGGVSLIMDQNLCGSNENYLYCIRNEKDLDMIRGFGYHLPTHLSLPKDDDLYKTVSIETIQGVVKDILLEQNQAEYNIMEIKQSINEIQVILSKTINSISKIDDMLIGNLFNSPDFSTKWINQDVFKMCKKENKWTEDSNCKNEEMFHKGRKQVKDKGKVCTSITDTQVHNISLFEDPKINELDILISDLKVSYLDLEGWSWITDQMLSISNVGSDSDPQSSGSSSFVSLIEEMSPFGVIWKTVIGLTTPIAWLSFIMLIFKRN